MWQKELIFSEPPNTHVVNKGCLNCGKSVTIFKGTATEWKERFINDQNG